MLPELSTLSLIYFNYLKNTQIFNNTWDDCFYITLIDHEYVFYLYQYFLPPAFILFTRHAIQCTP